MTRGKKPRPSLISVAQTLKSAWENDGNTIDLREVVTNFKVRYDNKYGKGDHKHINGVQENYRFVDVETLVADFLADIAKYGVK